MAKGRLRNIVLRRILYLLNRLNRFLRKVNAKIEKENKLDDDLFC